ncbi:riboflavin synthase [Peredibacter starrii]|uniref:Riboflavin synthase n=1 Tax=Peredibacter starrii TaxID=28202 RepID=A0AAX4HKP2_9BACT|nr:riboflavin synthase [Peredibacter starrii]WPU63796.1 riboflavin synthase [Peredibacter starrii]
MFTGLIQEVGTIQSVVSNAEGKEFIIRAPDLIKDIQIDDSVATNGVCLTATKIAGDTFKVQAIHVTLEKTSIGYLKTGDKVNLELSLRPHDRLGGHFVQGHVNALGKIKKIEKIGNNWEIEVSFPKDLRKYMISEGSIALDGISLTIARLTSDTLTVAIIPHTLEKTSLSSKKVGDHLNLEVDMIAKYIENFLRFDKDSRKEEWAKNFFDVKYED